MGSIWFWSCVAILAVLWGRGGFAAPENVRVLHSIRLTATLGLIIWLVISALGAWSQPEAEIAMRGLFVWALVSGGAIAYHARLAVFGIIFYMYFIVALFALVWWSTLPPKGQANLSPPIANLPDAPWAKQPDAPVDKTWEERFGQWEWVKRGQTMEERFRQWIKRRQTMEPKSDRQ